MEKNVCIVVLGDIGRSPRMQYHSLSLAKAGYKVDIIGYGDTKPNDGLIQEPLINYHYLVPVPTLPLGKIVNYAIKTIWQSINLLFLLTILRRPDNLLVQNPPAIPTLLVTYFYTLFARCKFIMDWHNYAYTIMALNLSKDHLLVKITRFVESFIGRRADASFCVSNEMKMDLEKNWNIKACTLYDKPPVIFQPLSIKEKMRAMSVLSKTIEQLSIAKFFTINDDDISFKANRPGILVSSTSWTEDEDFELLLEALQNYEKAFDNRNTRTLCKLICIITGRGPLKAHYCYKIAKLNFKNVIIITPWLEADDYPKILGIADLGVCLHTSSSGLDLPMKVVDMFGCELPVCAYKFRSLKELVKHKENGFVFENASELTEQLKDWFSEFPNNQKQQNLERTFKECLKDFQNLRWEENWQKVALKHFK